MSAAVDKLVFKLRTLFDEDLRRNVSKALFTAAEEIQVHAQISITTGSVTGKGHVPSLPGQPPNNDTGVLANNIEALQRRPMSAEVRSQAPYAVELEFGTSKMAARPYMGPARDALRGRTRDLVAQAINASNRKKAKG